LAEGILRRKAQERGISIEIDSAGTGDYHLGELPDPRSRKVGLACGCNMDMRARQVRSSDFKEFDVIVAMDQMNLRDLKRWPEARDACLRLATSFDPSAVSESVPDPYYGELEDFEFVRDMLEVICDGILNEVATKEKSVS
jgi:protein-tyrosine phosphatase